MDVQFLGSGDAFGSGGRFNTCIMVQGAKTRFLIDCGASSMIALRRFDIDPNDIDLILLTHLHGDHFGGVPFFILDAQLMSRRQRPLVIVGPKSTRKRLTDTMENLFPGSTDMAWRFDLVIEEFDDEIEWSDGRVSVTPYRVQHFCGAPPYALRVVCDGKTVTYSGDTEWVDSLVPAARDADLFIAEAYFADKKMKYHLDLDSLRNQLGRIRPKRLILTHMSDDMLARIGELDFEMADDGMIIQL